MEEENQQGLNLSEDKVFGRIGKLVMINDQLSEMLSNSQQRLQELTDENEKLKKENELLKVAGSSKKPKVVSEN